MTQQRTTILDAAKTALDGWYGPSGSEDRIFRKVWRRAWRPNNSVRPAATIVDNGQKRVENEDDAESEIFAVAWVIVIDLAENWDRQDPYTEWSDYIADIIKKFHNWCGAGCGEFNTTYVSDDPFDVLLVDGASKEIWTIEFETQYIAEVNAIDVL